MARAAASQAPPPHFGARWYIRDARTLRIEAGLSIAKLAGEAKVSRDSIRRIEANMPVTDLVASKVIKALKLHFDGSIRLDDRLTTDTPNSS
jgi:predicted transcriptional regulator